MMKQRKNRRANAGRRASRQSSQTQKGNASLSNPIPPSMGIVRIVPMTFTAAGVDGTVAPGFATTNVSLNDINDLDGAGSQPKGFDQISALFARYRVLSVTWEIAWIGASANPQQVTVYPCYPDAVSASIRAAREKELAVTHIVNNYFTVHTKGNIRMQRFLGASAADVDFGAAYNASPAKEVTLRLAWAPINTGVSASITWVAKLIYQVEWSSPRIPADA